MAIDGARRLAANLSDHFADVWKLLSETTLFLSRTKDSGNYENQLRSWRAELQAARRDQDRTQRVRSEIVELRKSLRLQGYDLSLASDQLRFEGFRNDACIREGFRRLVLFFTEDDMVWLTGEDNHVSLADFLELRLQTGSSSHRMVRIRERHFLWYRRRGRELVLSGSDTETKQDFARLEAIGDANSLLFLSKLKKLR